MNGITFFVFRFTSSMSAASWWAQTSRGQAHRCLYPGCMTLSCVGLDKMHVQLGEDKYIKGLCMLVRDACMAGRCIACMAEVVDRYSDAQLHDQLVNAASAFKGHVDLIKAADKRVVEAAAVASEGGWGNEMPVPYSVATEPVAAPAPKRPRRSAQSAPSK